MSKKSSKNAGQRPVLTWFVEVNELIRKITNRATYGRKWQNVHDRYIADGVNEEIKYDLAGLQTLWRNRGYRDIYGDDYMRHLQPQDYDRLVGVDLPDIQRAAEAHLVADIDELPEGNSLENLLHPAVRDHSLHHYQDGHFREAVLNAVISVFDLLRKRSGIDADGAQLVATAFSLESPRLILSELESESGRNDQKGFIQIFQGAYLGIRNPQAHSLQHDLNALKAAQYLVFASLLARRVDEAKSRQS